MEEKQINTSSMFEEHFDEKNIEVIGAHSITEETFENLAVESTPEKISPKSNLNKFRGEVILFLGNVDKILEKDTFYCYSCGFDDWFDCDCSYSEYESKSEKKVAKDKKKIVKASGEIDTNENTPEAEMDNRWPCKKTYVSFADDTFVDEIKDLAEETKGDKQTIEMSPDSRVFDINDKQAFDNISELDNEPFLSDEQYQNSLKGNKSVKKPEKNVCSKCKMKCKTKGHLRKHIKKVHDESRADMKSIVANNDAELKKCGKKEMKGKQKQKNYVCNYDECKASFYSIRGLKLHTDSIHLKLRHFICNRCSFTFTQKQHLQNHMNSMHLNVKPFKCDLCPFSFAKDSSLVSHRNGVHLKKRPFKCFDCTSSFLSKVGLTVHINSVHLKLKPHKCGQCSVAFSRKLSLKQHINEVHLKLRPFKCSACQFSFGSNSNLKKHVKRIHEKSENT